MKKILVLIILFSGFAASSFAQVGTATRGGTSHAVIVTPISIGGVALMEFGKLAVTASDGTAIISPTDVFGVSGGVSKVGNIPLPISAAFTVTGQASTAFTVGISDNVALSDGAGHTMTISDFTNNSPGNTGGTGTITFNVGATLNVTGGQVPGDYTGTFNVNVIYN